MCECRGRVLVADDEPVLREMMTMVLEDMGLDVVTAVDGRHCIELFREQAESIALAIIDVTMPGMDGLACLRQLRRMRPDVRVILSSGYSAGEIESAGAADGFLRKPYMPDALRQAVRALL